METVEKHNCRFSTVPTAPTAADNQQPTKTTDDRLHKMLDATIIHVINQPDNKYQLTFRITRLSLIRKSTMLQSVLTLRIATRQHQFLPNIGPTDSHIDSEVNGTRSSAIWPSKSAHSSHDKVQSACRNLSFIPLSIGLNALSETHSHAKNACCFAEQSEGTCGILYQ